MATATQAVERLSRRLDWLIDRMNGGRANSYECAEASALQWALAELARLRAAEPDAKEGYSYDDD